MRFFTVCVLAPCATAEWVNSTVTPGGDARPLRNFARSDDRGWYTPPPEWAPYLSTGGSVLMGEGGFGNVYQVKTLCEDGAQLAVKRYKRPAQGSRNVAKKVCAQARLEFELQQLFAKDSVAPQAHEISPSSCNDMHAARDVDVLMELADGDLSSISNTEGWHAMSGIRDMLQGVNLFRLSKTTAKKMVLIGNVALAKPWSGDANTRAGRRELWPCFYHAWKNGYAGFRIDWKDTVCHFAQKSAREMTHTELLETDENSFVQFYRLPDGVSSGLRRARTLTEAQQKLIDRAGQALLNDGVEKMVASIGWVLARALKHMQAKGLVHRDLKRKNVLVQILPEKDPRGGAKPPVPRDPQARKEDLAIACATGRCRYLLADFGGTCRLQKGYAARVRSMVGWNTSEPDVDFDVPVCSGREGTTDYMPPDFNTITASYDTWMLGLVLWETWTGAPWTRHSSLRLSHQYQVAEFLKKLKSAAWVPDLGQAHLNVILASLLHPSHASRDVQWEDSERHINSWARELGLTEYSMGLFFQTFTRKDLPVDVPKQWTWMGPGQFGPSEQSFYDPHWTCVPACMAKDCQNTDPGTFCSFKADPDEITCECPEHDPWCRNSVVMDCMARRDANHMTPEQWEEQVAKLGLSPEQAAEVQLLDQLGLVVEESHQVEADREERGPGMPDVERLVSVYREGEQLRVTCKDPKLVPFPPVVTCSETGWERPIPKCVYPCPDVFPPDLQIKLLLAHDKSLAQAQTDHAVIERPDDQTLFLPGDYALFCPESSLMAQAFPPVASCVVTPDGPRWRITEEQDFGNAVAMPKAGHAHRSPGDQRESQQVRAADRDVLGEVLGDRPRGIALAGATKRRTPDWEGGDAAWLRDVAPSRKRLPDAGARGRVEGQIGRTGKLTASVVGSTVAGSNVWSDLTDDEKIAEDAARREVEELLNQDLRAIGRGVDRDLETRPIRPTMSSRPGPAREGTKWMGHERDDPRRVALAKAVAQGALDPATQERLERGETVSVYDELGRLDAHNWATEVTRAKPPLPAGKSMPELNSDPQTAAMIAAARARATDERSPSFYRTVSEGSTRRAPKKRDEIFTPREDLTPRDSEVSSALSATTTPARRGRFTPTGYDEPVRSLASESDVYEPDFSFARSTATSRASSRRPTSTPEGYVHHPSRGGQTFPTLDEGRDSAEGGVSSSDSDWLVPAVVDVPDGGVHTPQRKRGDSGVVRAGSMTPTNAQGDRPVMTPTTRGRYGGRDRWSPPGPGPRREGEDPRVPADPRVPVDPRLSGESTVSTVSTASDWRHSDSRLSTATTASREPRRVHTQVSNNRNENLQMAPGGLACHTNARWMKANHVSAAPEGVEYLKFEWTDAKGNTHKERVWVEDEVKNKDYQWHYMKRGLKRAQLPLYNDMVVKMCRKQTKFGLRRCQVMAKVDGIQLAALIDRDRYQNRYVDFNHPVLLPIGRNCRECAERLDQTPRQDCLYCMSNGGVVQLFGEVVFSAETTGHYLSRSSGA